MERDLSVLSIYLRIFLHVFNVYRLVLGILFLCWCIVALFYCIFICVSCFGLVVSTCQMIGWKDSSDDAFVW